MRWFGNDGLLRELAADKARLIQQNAELQAEIGHLIAQAKTLADLVSKLQGAASVGGRRNLVPVPDFLREHIDWSRTSYGQAPEPGQMLTPRGGLER